MLTAFQCSIGAYMTEDGELLCEQCFQSEDVYAKPVSNYGLDEWQTEQSQGDDYWGEDDDRDHSECEQALFDLNGHELREEYHYGHEEVS